MLIIIAAKPIQLKRIVQHNIPILVFFLNLLFALELDKYLSLLPSIV